MVTRRQEEFRSTSDEEGSRRGLGLGEATRLLQPNERRVSRSKFDSQSLKGRLILRDLRYR